MTDNATSPLDIAYERFCSFVEKAEDESFWESLKTEADARMKLIDPIFVDVLGWPEKDIFLEDNAQQAGRIDYRMEVNGLNRLIVEAKREGRDLGINADYSGRFFKLNGPAFSTEAAEQAIEQLIGYCSRKSAELACATNGRQWFVFRGSRIDGLDVMDGKAFAFGSLAAVKSKFQLFYDLLAHESVRDFRFRAEFLSAEGKPVRAKSFRDIARPEDTRTFIPSDKLSQDLDKIMLSFFQDLGSEDDAEVRRECFVTTSESNAAERNLSRISEDLRDRVKSLSTDEGQQITEVIKRAKEMQKHEMILLVGTKGSGKTTFIERFFKDVLDPEIADDCLLIRIDLAPSSGDSNRIVEWLDQHLLAEAERVAFKDKEQKVPDFKDLRGMFSGEYLRWKEGPYQKLYNRDKDAFQEKFGEHIENIRQTKPRDFLVGLLRQLAGDWNKVPCIVFDNADHYGADFQEAVFNYANAIYQDCMCLMILPITDTTSWQLPKQGGPQSFFTESFFLPNPPTEHVLKKRIEFIETKVGESPPEAGKGYFFGRGIPLELDNIKAFAATLQTLFISTGEVAQWIGRLANQDIRRCLRLTRDVVSSPHLEAHKLLAATRDKSTMVMDQNAIKLAIIQGKYDIYPVGMNSFVQNVFDLVKEFETTPLLPSRVLEYLRGAWDLNKDNDNRYVSVSGVQAYFREVGVEPPVTLACINNLLETGLVVEYDPTKKSASENSRVQVSPSGLQHLNWSLRDWTYIESMALVSPIFDQAVFDKLKAIHEGLQRTDFLREFVKTFISYLLLEDSSFVKVPDHELYQGQTKLVATLQAQCTALRPSSTFNSTTRFARRFGRVRNWETDRGFGIIAEKNGVTSFLHVRNIVSPNDGQLPPGTTVEFEVENTGEREEAVNVVVIPKD